MDKYVKMKLSDYAKEVGVSYRAAWRWYKEGKIQCHQMPTGTVIITEQVARKALGEKGKKQLFIRGYQQQKIKVT